MNADTSVWTTEEEERVRERGHIGMDNRGGRGILHIIVQMIEPVSITQNSSIYGCECFGLGIFMVYNPPCANLNNVENRAYIYYQGVLSISTATVLMLDNWEDETKRIVSVAIRNNAIMDTTESAWMQA